MCFLTINSIFLGHNKRQFKNDVHRMYQRVFHHQLPPEEEEVRQKRSEITEKVIANEDVDFDVLTPEEQEFILEKRKKKIESQVKKSLYGWKDLE